MYYTGIGSRATPGAMLKVFTRIATRLNTCGYTLRSGGADGADSAFEAGADCSDIYLPWKGFNNNASELYEISDAAYEMAELHHPAWNRCSPAARKFHARNCYQVLGYALDDPAKFIICWTPGGKAVGGTGQALRIAATHGIRIVNFGADPDLFQDGPMELLRRYVEGEDA